MFVYFDYYDAFKLHIMLKGVGEEKKKKVQKYQGWI